jgi:hypothetical protein
LDRKSLLLLLGEFIVNRLMIGLLCASILNVFGIISAYALEFEQKENIVFVSGNDIDFIDIGRLQKALANGVNAVVLSKIGSGRIDVLAGLGRLIQKANVTTVATDLCGASCAYLFMAGRERRYGTLPGTTGQTPIFLALAGATVEGSSKDAHSTATYAYFRDAFSDAMPSDLLNKYTTGGKAGQAIAFTRPSRSFPEGEIAECVITEDKTKSVDCKTVQGLTPMSVGALTSIEPFDLSDRTSSILSPVALADPISVNVLWSGTHNVDSRKQVDDPTALTGKRNIYMGWHLDKATDAIAARLGTQFGVNYRFDGPVYGEKVRHRIVWTFPPPGITNPVTGEHRSSRERENTCAVGAACLVGWTIDEPWELVPGKWKLEVWYSGKLVVNQTFDVTVDNL